MQNKYLFVDRDGTIIEEPADNQVDSLEKVALLPGVINALQRLQASGYKLVLVSNQDGVGTAAFPQQNFERPQQHMLAILASQGIHFDDIRICPHKNSDHCHCRKPRVGLVLDYLTSQCIDRRHSRVIGDRDTDMQLAANMGIEGIKIGASPYDNWAAIVSALLESPRTAELTRTTAETAITIAVNLDDSRATAIDTGIGFFDHMLEQLARHSGTSLHVQAKGDLHIDDHHCVEDIGIALGQAMREALGDKLGIARYGFVLPMDESQAHVVLDLSGRFYCHTDADFPRDQVGGLSTEMVRHFFYSFAEGLKATLHIQIRGTNTHHMVEAGFKALGRALGQAITQVNTELPSTKGVL